MGIQDSRWFQIVNGWTGLTAIVVSLILFLILIIIYIIRIRREPLKVFSFFTDDYRSTPTKILRVVVFLLLTIGLVAVIYYNIHKMAKGDPVISTSVVENTITPSILFCANTPNDAIEVVTASYFYGEDNSVFDLTNSFNDIPEYDNSPCKLLNETLIKLPEGSSGGQYEFVFASSTNLIDVVIGDLGNINKFNKNLTSQIDIHSSIAEQVIIGDGGSFQYAETRYVDLVGGKTHRSFTFSTINYVPQNTITGQAAAVGINIMAPKGVVVNSENPALDLATFFGNFGGYLTICGVFGFLFGSGKMSPFGFVTDYCFPIEDKKSLVKNLGTDSNDNNDLEKATPESGPNKLLTEYYVDMELFSK